MPAMTVADATLAVRLPLEQYPPDPNRGAILRLMKLLVKIIESVSSHGGNALEQYQPDPNRGAILRLMKLLVKIS